MQLLWSNVTSGCFQVGFFYYLLFTSVNFPSSPGVKHTLGGLIRAAGRTDLTPAVWSGLDDQRVRSCERGGRLCDLLSPLARRTRGLRLGGSCRAAALMSSDADFQRRGWHVLISSGEGWSVCSPIISDSHTHTHNSACSRLCFKSTNMTATLKSY